MRPRQLRFEPIDGPLTRSRWYQDQEETTRSEALDVLALFQERLLPRLDQKVSQLSYANRRRVEIACALEARLRLLLLDEPAAGMNPLETALATALVGYLRKAGQTVLLIDHDMKLVMSISDKLVVLVHGVKIAEGPHQTAQNDLEVIEACVGRRQYAALD